MTSLTGVDEPLPSAPSSPGQSEPAVEVRQVLPDVGDRRGQIRECLGPLRSRFGLLGQHHRDAAAGDPAVQERLDAVGATDDLRRVTRRLVGQAVGRYRTRRAGRRRRCRAAAGQQVLAGVISLRCQGVGLGGRLVAEARGPRWIGEGELRHAVASHALRVGKFRAVGRRLCRGRAGRGRGTAAARRQHGDGCHDGQACRAPRAPVAAGLVVHRGRSAAVARRRRCRGAHGIGGHGLDRGRPGGWLSPAGRRLLR
jgi:hypothetical protein